MSHTVGIDIGTTSVKAVAADADGRVLARARVPHALRVPAADLFEHDADQAWHRGVRRAWKQVREGLDVAGVCVAAMVPSLCAVDGRGRPVSPGLLYGDARGAGDRTMEGPGNAGETLGFLRWLSAEYPDAAGYWPAQAVGNCALSGRGVLDAVSAMSAFPLFGGAEWDAGMAASVGADASKLPPVRGGNDPIGEVDGAALAGGTIDAFAEQMVAGADSAGDALVILGATLITWAVIEEWREEPNIWTIPHTAPGKVLIGGPSNSGGLFLDWALRLAGRPKGEARPTEVPVFLPYVRGERTPLHDPHRRASVHGLALTHGPEALRRAAHEAGGFVVRHHFDLAKVSPRRIVATGGGSRSAEWVQALADCTGIPVDVVAVPEGGALGSAFLARVSAGLEPSADTSSRWARYSRTVDPDPAWVGPCEERYARFLECTGPIAPS